MKIERRKPNPFVAPSDRAAELPLTEWQSVLADCIERVQPVRIRHRLRSSFEHLRRSWKLHPHDSGYSLFASITAEEEAAAALILALQHKKYPNSNKLLHKSHIHKTAIWPLIAAVSLGLREKDVTPPKLIIKTSGRPRIDIHVDLTERTKFDRPMWGAPDEPFNFVLRSDTKGEFEIHRWERELVEISKENGFESIEDYIKYEANLRNILLYASDVGVPGIEFSDSIILSRASRVSAIASAVVGVLQTNLIQPFAVQCMEALLTILTKLDDFGFDYPEEPKGKHIRRVEQVDGSMKLDIVDPSIVTSKIVVGKS